MSSSTTKQLTSSNSFYRRTLPANLIALSSDEGQERFKRALCAGDAAIFFELIGNFRPQSHPAFCGLTTLSVALNTLGIDPERVWKHPWRWYSEELLQCCLDLEHVKKQGLNLDELRVIASCEGADTNVLRGMSVEDARRIIQRSVSVRKEPDEGKVKREIIIASYNRKLLGQTGSGHFSPIGAYDAASDSVLVLDVATFKYEPHWVSLSILVDATRSVDKTSGMERGFLTLRKPPTEKTKCFMLPECRNCSGKTTLVDMARAQGFGSA